jgi:putative membrane protein
MSKTFLEEVWTAKFPHGKKASLFLYLKGVSMGIADLIPGVSGGTIAFISGIYDQLIDAINSMNKEFFTNFLSFRFKAAFNILHTKFILILLSGILTSILGLAHVMHYVLTVHPLPTWGFFFGLTISSIILLYKEVGGVKSLVNSFYLLLGIALGYVCVSLIPVNTPDAKWFIFLCGMIGITAMILPGISGSFLLLILGKYEYITGALKDLFNWQSIYICTVFTLGIIAGLFSFSKTLRYFLKVHRQATMLFLTGLLVGTLKKIWPWKEVVESVMVNGKLRVLREANRLPELFDGEFYLTLALMVFGFVLILILEALGTRKTEAEIV